MSRRAAIAIAISFSVAIPSTAAGAHSFGEDMFGISTGGAIQNEDADIMKRDLDEIARAGARWVRIDINWDQIQGDGPTSYDWDATDRVVAAAQERDLKVLGVILYTPPWARPSGTSGSHPPDPDDYAEFAAAAAEHYSAMGADAYEVWNEPNVPRFWQPAPDPAAYSKLLKAAYPAIKAADPQATVVAPGLGPVFGAGTVPPIDFLEAIYANGGGDSFDAVSHHPYCWPALPGGQSCTAWQQMHATDPSLRSVMAANGDADKRIWATEFGAPTGGPTGVTEDQQRQMIRRAYSFWSTYDWGGVLFTYTGRDHGTDSSTSENFFGLLRHDFSEKPSFGIYQALAAAPETEVTSGPTGLTNDPTPTFEIASSEPPPQQFECRIDDSGPWSECSSPHTTQPLTDGDHTFAARAVDTDGNVDLSPSTRELTVDTAPPDTTITTGPDGTSSPTFEFESPDADASLFECRIDAGDWYACSSPHRTGELADGDHSFAVRAGDAAGNRDLTPDTRSFTVTTASTVPPSLGEGAGLLPQPDAMGGDAGGSLPNLAGDKKFMVGGGKVALRLECARSEPCEGRAAVTAEVGKTVRGEAEKLADGPYVLDAGEMARVTLKLTHAGRTLFRGRGKVRAKLVLHGAQGERSTTGLTLRKRRPG